MLEGYQGFHQQVAYVFALSLSLFVEVCCTFLLTKCDLQKSRFASFCCMLLMRLAPEICQNVLRMEQERGQSKIDALVMRNKHLRDANFIDTWVNQVRDNERKRESKTGCSNRRITMSSDPHGPGLIQGGFVGNVHVTGKNWRAYMGGKTGGETCSPNRYIYFEKDPHFFRTFLKKQPCNLGCLLIVATCRWHQFPWYLIYQLFAAVCPGITSYECRKSIYTLEHTRTQKHAGQIWLKSKNYLW